MRLHTTLVSALALAVLVLVTPKANAQCTLPNQLTNGQIADATQVMANFNSLVSCINSAVTPTGTPPQGRLTLVSNTPVITADAVGQPTVYYTPYQGNRVPIAGAMYQFSELPYSLSSTAHLSGNLYDFFAYLDSGSVAICTGPAWTSGTARSAAITMTNGIWTNSASLTCTVSGGGSTTSISSGEATYLGTFYATANGQTAMQFNPTTVSGGTNNMLALWNAYNRVQITATVTDSGPAYSPTNSPARFNNSSSDRITYVDGLAQSFIYSGINFNCRASGSPAVLLYINRDSTSATQPYNNAATVVTSYINFGINMTFRPLLGLHYLQAMTNSGNTSGSCRPDEGGMIAILQM
ncbi:MAG: hypothetical protein GEU76_08620 [Alphaproteobacteria bacterium]|nr:hypothetical protein [Alphaproteobacteria bacterium]